MSSKHPKLDRPTNVDLVRNPGIGGSKGVTMAQASLDDLDALQGENTFEGDVENDTNALALLKAKLIRQEEEKREAEYAKKYDEKGDVSFGNQIRSYVLQPYQIVKDLPEAGSPLKSKGDGGGAMTDLQDDLLGENSVLSNRDKAQSSGERGQDSRWIQTEQREDHVANKGRG